MNQQTLKHTSTVALRRYQTAVMRCAMCFKHIWPQQVGCVGGSFVS